MADKMTFFLRLSLSVGILALIFAGIYHFSRKPDHKAAKTQTEVGEKSGLITKIIDVKLFEKTSNGDIWELIAKKVEIRNSDTSMDDVKMSYSSKDNGDLELTAKKGVMENHSRNVLFSGKVRVRSEKQLTLTTEYLVWRPQERLLTSDGKVLIETGFGFISGEGMVIDLNKKNLAILNSVKATLF